MKKLFVLLFCVLATATIHSNSESDKKHHVHPEFHELESAIYNKKEENKKTAERTDITPSEKLRIQLNNIHSIRTVSDAMLKKDNLSELCKKELERNSFITIAVQASSLFRNLKQNKKLLEIFYEQFWPMHVNFFKQYASELSERYKDPKIKEYAEVVLSKQLADLKEDTQKL